MRVVDDLAVLERGRPTIITIGAFDGVHRGHQFLIRQMVDRSRSLDYQSLVVSFDPRPQVILRPGSVQLTDAAQKERVIGALGADVLAMLGFTTELSQVPAGQFLVNILDHVNLAEIWVGADFAFGHDREGTVDFLIRSGATSGFAVHVLPRERLNGTPISSSLVRDLVKAGDVAGAAILLGHYFSVTGRVVSGHGRGLQLGFPTANVDPAAHQMLPAVGIYAAYLRYDEMRLPAAVSVGYNVVFGGESISVEAYILAFDGDLRGREVALDFVARIRDEQDFDSSDALIAEMRRDVEKVEEIVARADEPGELILLP